MALWPPAWRCFRCEAAILLSTISREAYSWDWRWPGWPGRNSHTPILRTARNPGEAFYARTKAILSGARDGRCEHGPTGPRPAFRDRIVAPGICDNCLVGLATPQAVSAPPPPCAGGQLPHDGASHRDLPPTKKRASIRCRDILRRCGRSRAGSNACRGSLLGRQIKEGRHWAKSDGEGLEAAPARRRRSVPRYRSR
jgi:hypothetical protein